MKKIVISLMALCMAFSNLNIMAKEPSSNVNKKIEQKEKNEVATDENLALHKPAFASSNESSGGKDVAAAFDGNPETRWSSNAGKDGSGIDETTIYVDLEAEMSVNSVTISWESRPNKFKIQTSIDGENWVDAGDVVDNGYLISGQNKKINTVSFFPVNARYVKMQGIQRRKADGNDGNTGYSIYEFEVYGALWNDDKFISEYLNTLSLPARVSRNFNVPLENEKYGVQVSWKSDNEAIQIAESGTAVVTKMEKEQDVELTASAKRGDGVLEKTFHVKVSSNKAVEYNIYPVPTKVTGSNKILNMSEEVTLVLEDSVNEYTQKHVEQIFKDQRIPYEVSSVVVDGETNILIGVKDGKGIVDEYFEDIPYDEAISSDKAEGYVLNVDEKKNMIAILGHENTGSSYGVSTLDQMVEQSSGVMKEVLIEDAPETSFRGFIEGFYGSPWSFENRSSLMEFCGKYKMNTYIYGPKNDKYHAAEWRTPYPSDQLKELARLVEVGKQTNVEFVWAIHVGGRIDLGNPADIQKVKDKFDQLYSIGVRQFAVFFDDSATDNAKLVEFMNNIQRTYVDQKGDMKPLVFCPQYYNKKNGNESYLKNLRNFDKRIEIMWTGDFVVSDINQDVVDYIVNLIDRPVYFWWNYPVNDLGRAHLLHMGPTEALSPNIKNVSGFVSNPMNQAQSSKVSLFSIADYTWNRTKYDSQKSWEDSWERIITDDPKALEAFKIFVQNCAEAPMSFGYTDESVYLIPYFDAFKQKFYAGEDYIAEAQALAEQFNIITESIGVLRNYKGTNNITGEMSLWMDSMEALALTGEEIFTNVQTIETVSKDNDDSLMNMMKFISEGREKLANSKKVAGGKQTAQRRIYPFIESVLNDFEDALYPALELPVMVKGYGSNKTVYSAMLDGSVQTSVELGAQAINAYFGVDMGKQVEIHDIEIDMAIKDSANKDAFYKKGVLEYSIDKENWKEIAAFDTAHIQIADANVKARYVRYRATEIFEDIATGVNSSNIVVNEMSVNKEIKATTYTNVEEYKDLKVTRQGNQYILASDREITLKPNEYIGIEFNKAKVLFDTVVDAGQLPLEISLNGKTWTQPENLSSVLDAKFIRVHNSTKENVKFTLGLSARNGGIAAIEKAEFKGGHKYSGSAPETVDGIRKSGLWFDNASGAYIEYTFKQAIPLASFSIYCETDTLKKAHFDSSEDGTNWKTISSYTTNDKETQVPFSGQKAKVLRLYLDQSGWTKINEVQISVLEDMQVVSGADAEIVYTVDKNIFTSYKAGAQKGEILYNTVNRMDENTFVVVKNKDSKIHVDGKVNGEWISYGDYTKAYNEIHYGKEVSEFKVSWEANTNLEIYEMNMKKAMTDTSALRSAIEEAEAYDSALYTVDSWKAFSQVLQQAKELLDHALDQEAVDDMVASLRTAMDELQKRANTSALTAEVEKGKDLHKNTYTTASWDAYEAVLKEAKIILADNSNVSQSVADAVLTRLQKAFTELKEDTTFVKSILKSAIDKAIAAEASEEFKTLAPSVKTLIITTRTAAQVVYDDADATNSECLNIWLNLADALHFLDFQADKALLSGLIEVCNAINTDDYKEGVEEFKDALAHAQAVYESDDVLQDTIDAAYNRLVAAKAGLIKNDVVNKSLLEALIKSIDEKVGDGSTYKQDANWTAFAKARADAKAILAKEDATQAEVHNAMLVLTQAYENIRLLPSEEQLAELNSFIAVVGRINRADFTKAQLKVIDETTEKAKEMLKDFDEKNFVSMQKEMAFTLDIIQDVDTNKLANSGITDRAEGASANTGDRTNAAMLLLAVCISGCAIMFIKNKRTKKA